MATKVNGLIQKVNPGNNTQYSIASTAYGYCETAAATAAKVVDMTGFTLLEGTTIHVKFKNNNTAANPTLNVNGTGAKSIVQYGTTAASTSDATTGWYAGAVVSFTYDGTSWVRDQGFNTDTHWTTHLYAGDGTAANKATTNNNTKISVTDNSTVRDSITIKGSGTTSVTSDANGVITISSADSKTGTVTSITPGNGLLNGTTTNAITTSGTLNINYGTTTAKIGTAAAGSATTVSRSDHVHAIDLATGDANGQVKIAGTNVSVKGLGSNAYTSTAYAPLASPALTGTPTAPTAATETNTTQIATTAFVKNVIAANDNYIPKDTAGNTQQLLRPLQLNGLNDVTLDAKINDLRANRLAFLPADQIIIEKTTNGGTTWTDAGISDSVKVSLFSETRPNVTLPLLNGTKNVNCGLRITFTAMKYNVPSGTAETQKYNYWNSNYIVSTERYNQLKEMYFWVNANTDTISVKAERATGANSTNWIKLYDSDENSFGMTGWSGSDYIRFSQGVFGGGTTQTGNYWNYRLTFFTRGPGGSKTTLSGTSTSSAQGISEIRGYGDTYWTAGNNYAAYDHLYSHDASQNATFPAKVTATGGFIGDISGNASSATKLGSTTVGSNVKAIYLNNGAPTASDHEFAGGYQKNNANLNTLYDAGFYSCPGGGVTNYPANGDKYATMIVAAYRKPSGNTTSDYAFQIADFTNNKSTLWFRTSNAGTWSAWQNFVHITANTAVGNTTTPVYVDKDGKVTALSYTIAKSVPADAIFSDTDTKVTSAANHYSPAADTNATLSADASSTTAATWNSTSLVTGVNIQRDAKGHVTGVTVDSIKMPANPNTNTDTLVKQTAKTDNVNYKLLGTATASPTSGNAAEAIYDANITINPSTHTITATNFAGNATTATTATKLGTTTVGSANQPIYLNAGTPTAITWKSLGSSHPTHLYSATSTFTTTTIPTSDWWVCITLNRTWDPNLTDVVITASYSNKAGVLYLDCDSSSTLWRAYLTNYGTNILAIKRVQNSSSKKTEIYLKLAKPVEYSGSTPQGTITVYSPVAIDSITQLTADPGGLIDLKYGYNSNTAITTSGTIYGNLSGNAATSSAVKDYNDSKLTKFGYSTTGMTSTSWLGSWDSSVSGEYRLRAITPANAVKSGIGTTAIGKASLPVYWNGSEFATITSYEGKAATAGAADTATTATSAGKWTTARTLTIGNKGQSVDGSQDVSWTLHDILNGSQIGTSTTWQQYNPGVYYVASNAAFTGEGNPENANGGLTPYRYGQLIVSRAGNGGVAQFYISHNDSGSSSYGIKYRSGWNNTYNAKWDTLLDSTNYTNYTVTKTGSGASGSWGISITGSSASCTGNAATATKFASNQSVALTGDVTGSASSQAGWSIATTLANSGVTADTYGNTSQQTPSHGGTFNIPYFKVDAKGRVTQAGTTTVKLPADNNTDTKVTQNNVTASNDYRVLLSTSANDTAETNTVNKNTNLRYNPSTNTLSTGNITGTGNLNITGNANLNGETYIASANADSLLVSGNANFVQIPTAPTPDASSNDTSVATTAFVTSALTGVSSPMRFIGSLGTGGTATSLPVASAANQGYTYKVITANTYQGVAAKVGDVLVSNGSSWILIPSGDEPSGTVTSITLKAGDGITLDTDNTAITSSGTRTISHKDTSSVSNLTANGRKYVTGLTFDTYGHVTGYTTGTETVTNSDTKNTAGSTDTSSKIYLIGATSQADNPQTYSDNEIFATSGVLTAKTFNSTSLTASQAVSTDANKNLVSTNLTVSDPTASGTGITYIATISQGATGKITATKSTVRSASTSQTGVTQYTEANTNTQLSTLTTTWTATPTDDTLFIRRDTGGGATFGQVKFSTLWSYIKGKITAGTYWANIKITDAAKYNAAPEMATLKLNGNTSATAASTTNVSLVFNTTTNALDFVFT